MRGGYCEKEPDLSRRDVPNASYIVPWPSDGTGAPSGLVLYGNILWDGALSLAKFFAWHERQSGPGSLQAKSSLELGAGTGVVGLTLGKLGATAAITDNEPEVVQLMRRNIQANGLEAAVSAHVLDWSDASTFLLKRHFDLIVAADVLYDGDGTALAHAVEAHMAERPQTVAYVANHHNPQRCDATMGFLACLLRAGFRVERLEDAEGRALGSLRGQPSCNAAFFRGARFAALDQDLAAVREARFRCEPSASPIERIQIFRISHSVPREPGESSSKL